MRVLTADHVDLRELLILADALGVRDEVWDVPHDRVRLLGGAGEGAELALHAADRRVVEVQVVDEEDLVGAAAVTASKVGQLAQLEDVVRLEERDAVVEVKALARHDLLADLLQCRSSGGGGHGVLS